MLSLENPKSIYQQVNIVGCVSTAKIQNETVLLKTRREFSSFRGNRSLHSFPHHRTPKKSAWTINSVRELCLTVGVKQQAFGQPEKVLDLRKVGVRFVVQTRLQV